jgi:hypothetical protein
VIGAIHLDVCACVVAWLRAARAASAVRFIISETSYICDLVFERLAQHFEHVPSGLRQLIQTEHPMVRQQYLPRSRYLSPTDQPASGIVWCDTQNWRMVTNAVRSPMRPATR